MKKLFRFIGKILFITMYPILIVAVIGLGIFVFIQDRDNKDAINEYREIANSADIQIENTNKVDNAVENLGGVISEYQLNVQDLNSRIEELENKIDTNEQAGYGEIKGSILPFFTEGTTGVSQYQRICAELVDNSNKQYCVTESVIREDFTLAVPSGEYFVSAELLNGSKAKAYYTEFIQCSRQDEDVACKETLREKYIKVTVEPSQTVENIDPIDWSLEDIE